MQIIEKNFNWIDGCYISPSTGYQITNDKYNSTDYIKIIFAKTLEIFAAIPDNYAGYAFSDIIVGIFCNSFPKYLFCPFSTKKGPGTGREELSFSGIMY